MKTVALWGYYGYGNIGDEAILAAVLSMLDGVRVKLLSGPTPSVAGSDKIEIVPRSVKQLLSQVKSSDAFVLGGGGLIHDRINAKSTWYHLAGPAMSRFFAKPCAAVGQQIGPFYRKSTTTLVKYALRKTRLTVRDQKSFVTAERLGLKPTLSADLAFMLNPDEPSQALTEQIKSLPKPITVFCPGIDPRWTPTPGRSADILSHIQSQVGGSILFLPFFPQRDDEYITQVLSVRNLKGLVLKSPIRWQDAFGCFRLADYSVTMRLHAMIASAIAGIPTLPIPYYPKVPMIASELGITNMIAHDESNWKGISDKFLAGAELQKVVLKTNAAKLKERAMVSKKVLDDLVNGLA